MVFDIAKADALWDSLDEEQRAGVAKENFALWAYKMVELPDIEGHPDFLLRPWFWDLYLLWHTKWTEAVIQKCTQVGLSTWATLLGAWGASFQWPKGFIYYLPHDEQMDEFVKQKVNPVIKETPFLRRTVINTTDSTDSLEVKKFKKSLAFFRGIYTTGNRKSITADVIFLDEFDDMDPAHIKEVKDRIRASEIQRTVKLGVPSVDDWGVNAAFKESTQNYWTMDCKECSKEWTVEKSWPNCVSDESEKGHLICPKCKAPAVIQDGQWKEQNPDSEIPGYTFNGAMNPTANLKAELADYRKGKNLHLWKRGFLGQPASQDGGSRMTSSQIKAQCCKEENGGGYAQELSATAEQECFMGVDTGASAATRRLYIARWENNKRKIVRLKPYEDLEDLMKMVNLFHVKQGVIDAGGEPTLAKELVEAFPRIFFRCKFQEGQIWDKWKEDTGMVLVDRTTALDSARDALYTETILPAEDDEDVQIFCDENAALIKVTEIVGKKATKKVFYKSIGPDHGGLTWAYTVLAMDREIQDATAKAVGGNDPNARLRTTLQRRGLA